MRLLLQRVEQASVIVEDKVVGSISEGVLVFLGIHKKDTLSCIDPLVSKLVALRLFPKGETKSALSLLDVKGEVLVVSQFTLYADCSKGTRPDFFAAAPSEVARPLYDTFIDKLSAYPITVQTGKFGAFMRVSLVNTGPQTFLLESPL